MGPLIDAELEKLDRRHAHLTKLGGRLVEALDIYRGLMRELHGAGPQPGMAGPMPPMPGYPYGGAPPPGQVPAGPMKYPQPFPQPQAPPQSPSMQPTYHAPAGQHPGVFPSNPTPNPMPYMGSAAYVNPFPGHPPGNY